MIEQFKYDVNKGLSAHPKYLDSKYFYDEFGDDLFVQIMHLPEYYLTDAEFEIFHEKTDKIIKALNVSKDAYFEIIELGAGDGTKTKELLGALLKNGFTFSYQPIDISQESLDSLVTNLEKEMPELKVSPRQGEYFEVLSSLRAVKSRKIVLFLGSNIGNLTKEQSNAFIHKLGEVLNEGDELILGVDLIKSASIVLPAYNDKKGVTAEFNYNILRRINRELGGEFDLSKFEHHPEYSEEEGVARSYLLSLVDQKVYVRALNKSFHFKKDEKILTEISRKFDESSIQDLIEGTEFNLVAEISDSKHYFSDYVFQIN